MGRGKILAGYSTTPLHNICHNATNDLNSLNFLLTNNDYLLFDYNGSYENGRLFPVESAYEGIVRATDGKRFYLNAKPCGMKTDLCCGFFRGIYCHPTHGGQRSGCYQ